MQARTLPRPCTEGQRCLDWLSARATAGASAARSLGSMLLGVTFANRTAARVAVAALAALAGAWVRARAARDLPVDFDELDYLPAAFRYAERMTPGRWTQIPAVRENPEHPALVKLVYALDLRVRSPPEPRWDEIKVGTPIAAGDRPAFAGARTISAVSGVLQVLVIALVEPVGALWLALDTYHAKYTSQAYLEAIPGLAALLAVLLFEHATRRRAGSTANGEAIIRSALMASAAGLGVATAGKALYGLIVGATLLAFLVRRVRQPRLLVAYPAIAMAAFVVADPSLWLELPARFREVLTYHWQFSHSAYVQRAGLPWYQPLVWLTSAAPTRWHPGLFPTVLADWTLLAAAALGASVAVRERPLWLAWAGVGLLFLFLWPTKWPQYTMLVRPPLAVCAGLAPAALQALVQRYRRSPG